VKIIDLLQPIDELCQSSPIDKILKIRSIGRKFVDS